VVDFNGALVACVVAFAVRSVGCEVAHPCASEAVARTARGDISLFMKNPLYIDGAGCDLLYRGDCKVDASPRPRVEPFRSRNPLICKKAAR
jgi:hypothetical protein